MSLVSSSPSPPPTPEPVAPNRSQRTRCWAARDAFFACLDAHGIIDSLKGHEVATAHCGKQDIAFKNECAGSWVEYFKKRRVMEHKKDELMKGLAKEGAVKLELPQQTPPQQRS
ncbi:cytochrome oxidase c subunit VIb-domain-containing protein [Kalaharituber pfeilii]|nr:cytochrome oxidase c subunit VIb-domain-containing protein [Kalaharituber pfeilii]